MPRRPTKLRRSKRIKKRKPAVRLNRMTIATYHYDKRTHQLTEYEAHFKIARRGRVTWIRRRLAKLGAGYFQRWLHRRYRTWIPKRKLRIAFERERHARKQQRHASVRWFGMRRVKRRWTSQELPTGKMSYRAARKRRRRERPR